MTDLLAATRRSLHGVAELVLAGPAYRSAGRIRLSVRPGGFATVALPGSPRSLRVEGTELVVERASGDPERLPLRGTFAELAAAAGVAAGPPEGLYADGSGVGPDDEITVDAAAARTLTDAFAAGDAALRDLVASQSVAGAQEVEPVLWPEHFDVAVSLDEVNYGVSAGDSGIAEPYAYVGPWTPREGAFWDAPFGAARTVAELDGSVSALLAFFEAGRDAAALG